MLNILATVFFLVGYQRAAKNTLELVAPEAEAVSSPDEARQSKQDSPSAVP